jgi:hypothetical protein
MAETPPIKITERLTNVDTYKKYAVYVVITIISVLILVGGVSLWRWIFPRPDKQVNNPRVIAPFSKIEKDSINQSNTQIQVTEKPWEISVGGGVLRYDNKDGWIGGAVIKRKW